MTAKKSAPSIIRALVNVSADVIGLVELGLAIGWETACRLTARLDPRLYSERRRIRAVAEGGACRPSQKVAVFVVYSRTRPPAFTTHIIAALNRRSFNIIVVSNGGLDRQSRAALLADCCLLIERENVGRDFGGYKDGIRIALQRFPQLQRLIIANDSLYFLPGRLDALVEALDGPEDFIGVSEVFEHHYHVASFLLSFGPGVVADPEFRRFWQGYRPLATRMWAILQGEGELTRRLMAAGHKPHVLFRAQQLLPKLRALGADEREAAMALFSRPMRQALMSVLSPPSAAVQPSPDGFATAVVEEVLARNQMHAAGLAFVKFLGLPLIKRDIVYREQFTLAEIEALASGLGLPAALQGGIIADLDRRRPPQRRNVLRRLLYRHGFV